ncbi:MAG: SDR family NAD(P)-dependent oxidoreductase [Hyphomonadaceae bacterium]|nr:SDR family NAD(P)-dependent oxidoreductase [Hyphomonadaceae bacterium]
MIDWQGKTALVTGAASGIGQALAAQFAARGAHVIAADVNADALHDAAGRIGACPIVCDLGDPAAPAALVADAMAHRGQLDFIASNAGVGRNKRLANEAFDDAVIERLFQINLFSGLKIAQAYVRALDGRPGRIMFTASENSLSVPSAVRGAGLGLYAATKHGLLVAAEWLRDETAEKGLSVHVLMPGAVYTGLIAPKLPDPANAPAALDLIMPDVCAERALRGLDLGLFYIPTQPHLADDMVPRMDGVAAAVAALGLTR